MAQSNKEIMNMEKLSLLDKLKDIMAWKQSVEDSTHYLKSSKYDMMVAYDNGITVRHINGIVTQIKSKKTIAFVKSLVDMYVAAEAWDKENGAKNRPIVFEGFPPIGEEE